MDNIPPINVIASERSFDNTRKVTLLRSLAKELGLNAMDILRAYKEEVTCILHHEPTSFGFRLILDWDKANGSFTIYRAYTKDNEEYESLLLEKAHSLTH